MVLAGTVVVVTGAARGIGQSIARAFADRQARVVLVDILPDELRDTADAMKSAGGDVLPIVTDITSESQVAQLAETVHQQSGAVDVLVNCAGTFSVIGPVWEVDPEKWFRDVHVNLYGSFLVCRAFVKGMVERRRGYVINIVSSGGVGDPHAYSTSYASSKTGLMRLTEGLAQEVKEHGIKVFAVAPPAILTEMARFIMNDPAGQRWRPGFSKIFAEGRDTPPEAVADLIIELVSGKADQLTGRYICLKPSLDELLEGADRILVEDVLTLRIRQ